MELIRNPSPANSMAALLLLTLCIMVILLVRWTDDGPRPLLLKRMIARAGGRLDASTDPLLGEELASAARACAVCRNQKECEALLAEHFTNDIPEYCPNRRWIQALAANRPRGPAPGPRYRHGGV
jgi:hypothetical protein